MRTTRPPWPVPSSIGRETDAGILRLAPGVYRIKNTDFLTIRDRENFALDGCGAELISETSYFFMVQNCRQVLLENLTLDVDWNILRPASLGPGNIPGGF